MQLILSKSTIHSLRPSDAASLTEHIGTYSVAQNMSAIPHPLFAPARGGVDRHGQRAHAADAFRNRGSR
jgi:hypothetical protein